MCVYYTYSGYIVVQVTMSISFHDPHKLILPRKHTSTHKTHQYSPNIPQTHQYCPITRQTPTSGALISLLTRKCAIDIMLSSRCRSRSILLRLYMYFPMLRCCCQLHVCHVSCRGLLRCVMRSHHAWWGSSPDVVPAAAAVVPAAAAVIVWRAATVWRLTVVDAPGVSS